MTANEFFFGQDTHLSLGPRVQGHSEWQTRVLGPECGSTPMAWVRPAEEGGVWGRGRSHPRGRSDKKTNICWKSWWGSPSPAPSACPQLSLFSSLEFPPGQMDGITAPSLASRWTLYVPSTPVSTHASIKMSQSTCPKPSTSTLSLPSLLPGLPHSLASLCCPVKI